MISHLCHSKPCDLCSAIGWHHCLKLDCGTNTIILGKTSFKQWYTRWFVCRGDHDWIDRLPTDTHQFYPDHYIVAARCKHCNYALLTAEMH